MEVEAVDEGTVTELLVEEGAQGVKVNTPIAVLSGEGEAPAPKQDAKRPLSRRCATRPSRRRALNQARSLPPAPLSRSRNSRRHADGEDHRSRRAARRDGGRDAPRRSRLPHGRRGRRVPRRLQSHAASCCRSSARQRVVDTPITEHGFAGLGVGAAMAGLKPIVEFMTWNFAMQAIDQIINSAAKTLYMSGGQIKSSIVFRGPNGAACRVAAQHSQDYSSWYSHIPGLIVIAPYDAADAKGLLKAAIRNPNPVVFLEHEMLYGTEFEIPDVEGLDRPDRQSQSAPRRAPTSPSPRTRAWSASRSRPRTNSAKQGIEAEVIDLRTLRPLDTDTILESVKKTNRIVTVEEGWGQSRRRRRDLRARHGRSVRLSRCAADARPPSRCATGVRREPGSAGVAERRQDRRCRESGDVPVIYSGACHCGAVSAEYETDAPVRLRQMAAASVRRAA